jgi:hypothetical protein
MVPVTGKPDIRHRVTAWKNFRVGTQPINVQLAAYGNVAKPEFAPDWQLRFQIRFLFPK